MGPDYQYQPYDCRIGIGMLTPFPAETTDIRSFFERYNFERYNRFMYTKWNFKDKEFAFFL